MQSSEDGVGGKNSGPTTYRASSGRSAYIAGDWETTILEAEVWVETATESGRRFMATRRK